MNYCRLIDSVELVVQTQDGFVLKNLTFMSFWNVPISSFLPTTFRYCSCCSLLVSYGYFHEHNRYRSSLPVITCFSCLQDGTVSQDRNVAIRSTNEDPNRLCGFKSSLESLSSQLLNRQKIGFQILASLVRFVNCASWNYFPNTPKVIHAGKYWGISAKYIRLVYKQLLIHLNAV